MKENNWKKASNGSIQLVQRNPILRKPRNPKMSFSFSTTVKKECNSILWNLFGNSGLPQCWTTPDERYAAISCSPLVVLKPFPIFLSHVDLFFFLAVKLRICLVDYKTAPNFSLAWGWVLFPWIYPLWLWLWSSSYMKSAYFLYIHFNLLFLTCVRFIRWCLSLWMFLVLSYSNSVRKWLWSVENNVHALIKWVDQ